LKVKVDENLPLPVALVLRSAGHDVDSVPEEGLTGVSDPEVIKAAIADGRMVFTLDRGFGELARSVGDHAGVVVLRLQKEDARSATALVIRFVAQHDLDELKGCTVIVQSDRVRIRRPE
jgi:predicted nuclease of predicted toxin-antitoxin system